MDIKNLLEKTLPGLGYELVDDELTPQGTLRVAIDRADHTPVGVEDCALVSRHLSRLFAVEDIDYKRLEVSSPGLDRVLKKPADFERFSGSLVKLRARLPVDGQKQFLGRLVGYRAPEVILEVDGKTVAIALENIERARIRPEF